jgi:hypothetical protein
MNARRISSAAKQNLPKLLAQLEKWPLSFTRISQRRSRRASEKQTHFLFYRFPRPKQTIAFFFTAPPKYANEEARE